MSKLAERIYDRLFGKKTQIRRYAAARLNNQNANWTLYPTGANYNRRLDLKALRARARQASRDDPHLSKFLSLFRSNVIGQKGIQLQCRARLADGTLNAPLNKAVEEAWWQWGHSETCTLSGKLDWKAVQRLVVTQLACDGEFLVQMVQADNPFGFALKVWDVNWLDELYNQINPITGNRIIMSVEVDDNDKPVAYWLTTPASELNFTKTRTYRRTRIDAEQMIHGFLIEDDETQVRGVTAFKTVLLTAKNFHGYTEGVIQSARFASNSFGFLKQTDGIDGAEYTGEGEDGKPILPNIDVAPLSMNALPPNWEMQQFDPKQPTQNHAAFSKTILMEMAAGLGVPYFYLAGDMEAVNFSSSRVGLDDARDIWKGLQDFIGTTLCRRVFHEWARAALLNKQIKMSLKDFQEIQNPMWRARGWSYIDPTKDITADILCLMNKTKSLTEVLAEQGKDIEDHFDTIVAEQKLADEKGIDLTYVTAARITDTGPAPADESGTATDTTTTSTPKREYTNGHAELVS